MLFHVAGLLREPVGSKRHAVIEPEFPVVRGEVDLVRLPAAVMVVYHGESRIEAECSRCLQPLSYITPVQFEEIFVQQVDVATGARIESELESDSDGFVIATDHTIDITEAVRQYTEMAAAMQPLCRPECPGLCPQCGQDLTARPCTCDRTVADSRWAALADLKLFPNG